MAELSKSEKIRQAREKWQKRAEDRPVQVTSPAIGHVVDWKWIKVDEVTLAEFDEFDSEV